ncbi:MAG: 50S ribosomal protein L7 [Oscillospiraceae bacterium]|nr:50S ribosomal protein L7 [Oscillospiraceae bacterium]
MDKALQYLALARKAGRIELGEEPAGAAARAQKARLILVAADAGDHTWRRAKSFVAGTEQLCIKVPFTKDEIGCAIGRTSLAIAAFTDTALALAFVKALPQPEQYSDMLAVLDSRAQRMRQRQQEAKAHAHNVRKGRK